MGKRFGGTAMLDVANANGAGRTGEGRDIRLARYLRLADDLRSRISTGEWAPGERLPSESDLAAAHNVALGTVRQAVGQLVQGGLLERVQGRGTFVRRPSFNSGLARFFRMVGADGGAVVPEGRVQSCTRRALPAKPADALGHLRGDGAIRIDRQRLIGERIVLIEEIWLDAERFAPLLDLAAERFENLLYPLYERVCGQTIARASETLLVERADRTAEPLGLFGGEPTVVIERVARGFDGAPLEWRRSIGRADEFRYSVELQ